MWKHLPHANYTSAAISLLGCISCGAATIAARAARVAGKTVQAVRTLRTVETVANLVYHGADIVASGINMGRSYDAICQKRANGEEVTFTDWVPVVLSGVGMVGSAVGMAGAAKNLSREVKAFQQVKGSLADSSVVKGGQQLSVGSLGVEGSKSSDNLLPMNLQFFAKKSGTNTVNPKDVKFMQSSIKNQTGDYTVLGNAQDLKNGTLKASDLPEMRIWQDDAGQLWTLDHRRLASFRLAELDSVPFKWATSDEVANQMWKMTTKTNGTSVKLKLGNGQSITIQ